MMQHAVGECVTIFYDEKHILSVYYHVLFIAGIPIKPVSTFCMFKLMSRCLLCSFFVFVFVKLGN